MTRRTFGGGRNFYFLRERRRGGYKGLSKGMGPIEDGWMEGWMDGERARIRGR